MLNINEENVLKDLEIIRGKLSTVNINSVAINIWNSMEYNIDKLKI